MHRNRSMKSAHNFGKNIARANLRCVHVAIFSMVDVLAFFKNSCRQNSSAGSPTSVPAGRSPSLFLNWDHAGTGHRFPHLAHHDDRRRRVVEARASISIDEISDASSKQDIPPHGAVRFGDQGLAPEDFIFFTVDCQITGAFMDRNAARGGQIPRTCIIAERAGNASNLLVFMQSLHRNRLKFFARNGGASSRRQHHRNRNYYFHYQSLFRQHGVPIRLGVPGGAPKSALQYLHELPGL